MSDDAQKPNSEPGPRDGAWLTVTGIGKAYGDRPVLQDISLSVDRGEVVGLLGPNGAGKTTLFNVISGFLRADQGEMHYHGKDISSLKPHQVVGLGMARTFQIVRPFKSMSVFENTIVAGLSPRSRRSRPKGVKSDETAMNVLERVALDHKKDESVASLPMGDLRRLEIARALATYPQFILLDEPFSGLSLKEMDALAGLIRNLLDEKCTILIIEHKLKILMSLAPRILVLDYGKVLADGTPAEIA
ncbi:MAG: ABC transporter ATP-binding protein, partial [Sphingomonadales bacterium]|nr:ABC transporter ATP-binding protein [Sphingomonadales bacterium]